MSEKTPPARRRISAKAIAGIALIVVGVVFALSNLNEGTIRFLGLSFTMPVWIWFIAILVLGVVAGSLFPWFHRRRRR